MYFSQEDFYKACDEVKEDGDTYVLSNRERFLNQVHCILTIQKVNREFVEYTG